MSILIHGMKMPKDGDMLVLCVGYNGKVLHPIEFATEDFLFAETGKTAVELPPHGRLGDLDALCEGLVSNHPVVIYAKNADTIIPAEGGDAK